VVYDESGNGNDAQLVNSNCLHFDNVMYAKGDIAGYPRTSQNISLKIRFKFDSDSKGELLIYDGDASGNRNFTMFKITNVTNEIAFYLYDSAGTLTNLVTGANLKNVWHNWHVTYDGSTFLITDIDTGETIESFVYTGGIRQIPNSIVIFGAVPGGAVPFLGDMCDLEYCGAEYVCAEGGLTETLSNKGIGGDLTLFNATYPTLWATQDVFHYNFLNGFDLYENGTAGEEIRVPIGHTFSQSGYTYTATYQAGIWHNGAETQVKLPDSYSAVQDATPISSLTDNKNLEWVDGKLRGFSAVTSTTSTLTEESNGTRFYCPDVGNSYILQLGTEAGKTYNYMVVVSAFIGGSLLLKLGTAQARINSLGVTAGVLVADDVTILLGREVTGTDITVSKLYVWEAGTVPPLSYEEMETNYNGADQVFSNTEEGKKKKIVAYDRELTTEEQLTIQKCIDAKTGVDVLREEDGVTPLTDENGIYLLEG
jgi:predicted RNA-binding Zn-ribbon protein involved in translation (DUF1610 family)